MYNNFQKQNLNSIEDADMNMLRKSNSLNNLTEMLEQNLNSKSKNLNKNFSSAQLIESSQPNEINQIQQQRFSLMDKKKQKWSQDISKENYKKLTLFHRVLF